MEKIHLQREPNFIAKYEAFPYQKEAFETIKDLEYAAVFHEQGLGKTKIAIDLILYWIARTSIDTVIVVTKKQLIQNWVQEFNRHTTIHPAVLGINKKNNYLTFCGPARVILANFELVISQQETFKLYLNSRNVAIIIDESAKLKNPEAKLTKRFLELAPMFKKRVIMTGTPVANRPYDIWAQVFFLDQGKSLGSNFNEFKKQTDLSNELASNTVLQSEFEDQVSGIYEKIKSFSVRETKNSGIIELPNKVYMQERVDFEIEQKRIYRTICEELAVEMYKDGKLIIDDSSAIVKRLLRLVQVVSNPKMVDERYVGMSAKEEVLDQIIKKIIENGEKCIVWSNFIKNVDDLCQRYKEYGSIKIHGKMNMADRDKSVDRFRTESCKILFATPASAKEGLTLTMANHVIFYDRTFSLDYYLQEQDRIHRISKLKSCYIHKIIVNGSIDEWIDVLLESKQHAAKLAQGDMELSEYKKVEDYSFGDLVKEILFPMAIM